MDWLRQYGKQAVDRINNPNPNASSIVNAYLFYMKQMPFMPPLNLIELVGKIAGVSQDDVVAAVKQAGIDVMNKATTPTGAVIPATQQFRSTSTPQQTPSAPAPQQAAPAPATQQAAPAPATQQAAPAPATQQVAPAPAPQPGTGGKEPGRTYNYNNRYNGKPIPDAPIRSTESAQGTTPAQQQAAASAPAAAPAASASTTAAAVTSIPGFTELLAKNPQQALVLASAIGPLLQYQQYMSEDTLRKVGEFAALEQQVIAANGGVLGENSRLMLRQMWKSQVMPQLLGSMGISAGTAEYFDLANNPAMTSAAIKAERDATKAVDSYSRSLGLSDEEARAAHPELYDSTLPPWMRQNAVKADQARDIQGMGFDPTVFHDPEGFYGPDKTPRGMKYKGPDGKVVDPWSDYPASDPKDMGYNSGGSPYGAPFTTNYSKVPFT